MKDAAMIKCMSLGCSTAIVLVMLVTDGVTAQVAASGALAALSGIGGYAIAEARKAKDV